MGKTSVKENTFYNIIKSCSSLLFPLITLPYISRVLLADNVGKINFGNSIINYFSLAASLGVTTYAVRECARVRSDEKKLGTVASQIISINICTTILSYVVLLITLFLASPLEEYRCLIVIQSTAILFTTLGADWLNTAMEDFKYITIRTVFFQLVALVLMFIFVKKPEDYLMYAAITVLSTSGGNIVNIFYRKKYCKTYFTFQMNLKRHLSPIFQLFAMLLSQQVFVNSDTTILGLVKGDYQVGLYSTSVKIYNIVNTLVSSITWVVMPKLSSGFAKGDYKDVNKVLRFALGFIVTLGFPLVVGINIMASDIIKVVAGEGFVEATMSLKILTIAQAFSLAWCFVMNIVLLPAGKDKVCLRACVVSAIFNIVTNLIFIPQFGLNAAAATTAISQFIGLVLCIPYVNAEVKLTNLKYLLFPPVLGSMVIGALLIMINRIFEFSFFKVFMSVLICVVVYMFIQILLKNELILDFIRKRSEYDGKK